MKTFEYMIIEFGFPPKGFNNEFPNQTTWALHRLNELGKGGWELCSPGIGKLSSWFLKREIIKESNAESEVSE